MTALDGALCAEDTAVSEWWTGHRTDLHAKAALVCLDCPVRRQCADQAETERTAADPVRHGTIPVRPAGVWAGRLYDGTRSAPLQVRLSLACTVCSRTFVPTRSNVKRCTSCRQARSGAAA